MRGRDKPIACAVVAVLCIAAPVFAQAPADAPKVWTVTASAGLALTSGNSDTSTVNAAYDIVYDRQSRNVIKSDGLFLRGKTEGELSANRIGLNIRDEYSLTPMSTRTQLKLEILDTFKNKPPLPTIQQNDVAVLMAIVYKI